MSLADLPVITPNARNLIDRVYGYTGWLAASASYGRSRPSFHRPHFGVKKDGERRTSATRCGLVTQQWGDQYREFGTFLPTKWLLHFADPCSRCFPESLGHGPTCGGLKG